MGGAKLAGPFRKEPLTLFHWLETTDWPWRRSPAAHFRKATRRLPRVVTFCVRVQILLSRSFLSRCYRNPLSPLGEKKKKYLGCKQKCYLLIAILKPDNKKLVTLIPTGKTGLQRQFFPPHEADHSRSPISNPFTRLMRPEAQRILLASGQPVAGEVLLDGRPVRRHGRLLAGNSSLAVLTQVVHLFSRPGLPPLNVFWAEIATLGLCQDDPNTDKRLANGLKTVYTKLFWNQDKS